MNDNVKPLRKDVVIAQDNTDQIVKELRDLADKFERREVAVAHGTGVHVAFEAHDTFIQTYTCGDDTKQHAVFVFDAGHAIHMRTLFDG